MIDLAEGLFQAGGAVPANGEQALGEAAVFEAGYAFQALTHGIGNGARSSTRR